MRSKLLPALFALLTASGPSPSAQEPGHVREATAADAARMRPGPPTGLTARMESRAVVLSWKAIPLEKIVGYEVYRRVGEAQFAKLVQVKEPVFVDKNVPKGAVEYAISAVDMYSNKSPLSKPVAKPTGQETPKKAPQASAR